MYYIFRNYTIEPFFKDKEAKFSGYEDISFIDKSADSYIWFYSFPLNSESLSIPSQIDHYLQQARMVLSKIPSDKQVLVFTIENLFPIQIELANNSISDSINRYNDGIRHLSEKYTNVKILDFSSFIRSFAQKDIIDWKYFFLTQLSLSPKIISEFSRWFEKQEKAITYKRKKCIVLDLDNTLWGGILGEDGIEQIKIGGNYPGNAFLYFQQRLLELSKTGVILAICSKNNASDVLEAWEINPYMILRKEHFTVWEINWEDKATNISKISLKLNIGLDSIVFIDDNPAERELIRQKLPMVEVPDFPIEPYLLPIFFRTIVEDYFLIYKLTDEDENKLSQYKANIDREDFKTSFQDYDSYLKSLSIEITIQTANTVNVPRLAQLTQKTNQFNLTTKRYINEQIHDFVNKGDFVFAINVKDRFGDNGLTGVLIGLKKEKTIVIDSFLLSCRILGKNIEVAFLKHILSKLKTLGFLFVEASYIKTSKNIQTETFYENIGFKLVEQSESQKMYHMDLRTSIIDIPTIYKIKEL